MFDVVVSVPGFVSIFYGNGDGTFQTGPNYAGLPDYMQATITDIDGDGNPDIVLGTSTGGIYTDGTYDVEIPMYQILMGRGDGTFVDSPVYTQGTYSGDKQIANADFNGDGKTDVLLLNASNGLTPNSLAMLPGNGTGSLGTAVTSSINITPKMLVAAKMNHDALADAVVAGTGNSGGELALLFNQGNGTFASEQDYSLAASPVSLAVGDFNGDGIPDVAVGMSGGVDVFFGQSNGTLGTPVQVDSSANPTGLAAGSLTTDGRTDLVVADQTTGTLHVYLGNANGTFTTVATPPTGATGPTLAALGDLNNDGKLDLIVTGFIPGTSPNPNVSNIYTFLGNGDGTFQAVNTLALAGTDGPVTSMALADFNNSGKLGAVLGNPSDYTEVLFGKGDGTFIDAVPALAQQPATVAAADLLGNGYPEILAGESSTQGQGASLTVLQNQPSGWVAASTTTTPTVTVSPNPSSITSAQSTQVTVAVSGIGATPTGSVTLSSGTYTSAATGLTSGSAVITVPGSSLAVATDTLTATYTPDSNSSSVYTSATGMNTVTVTPAPSFSLSNGGNIGVEASAATGNTSSITVTPLNGFTGTVNLSCAVTTIPTGAISPATCAVTPTVSIPGTTAQSGTLTVTTTTTTTAGAYAVTVTGVSGAITQMTTVGVTVTAYVPPPTFTLGNSGNISFEASATTGNTATINVTPANGFTGPVSLSCALTSAPTNPTSPATCGVTSTVTITGAGAQTGTLTVTTTQTTTAGTYAFTVTGMSGGIMQTTTVSASVTAYVAPSFALTNSGAISISSPGASTGNTSTITVTPSGGFTGAVTLTAALTSSPTGAADLPTFSFGTTSPVNITGATAGTGTLTVSTTPVTTGALMHSAPPGSRGVPWTAAGGAALACVLVFGIRARRRRLLSVLGTFLLLVFLAGAITSCGGSGGGGGSNSGNPGTTIGNYTITVTGTSGSITQTTTVNLTVN